MRDLSKEIESRIGNDVEVQHVSVRKNNGVVLNGYSVRKKGSSVSPSIYYPDDMTDEQIIDRVVSIWNGEQGKSMRDLEALTSSIFKSADRIYEHVVPALINRENNAEYLKDVVHRPFLDMEIVYRVYIAENSDFGVMSTILRKEHVERLEIDLETLHQSAMRNMNGTEVVIGINEMLLGLMFGDEEQGIPGNDVMYVITNKNKVNGAAVILSEDTMQEVHDKLNTDTVAVLPSSIHETIAIDMNAYDTDQFNQFRALVNEVNGTEVREEDVLSNLIYIHERNGEWRIA